MGLSGRKIKQRIPADPRNLAWADGVFLPILLLTKTLSLGNLDAAKFGTSYLSKFGWDASKGLGVEGDGRTSHIKVSHKLDMLGIGAAHQRDPNGIAWKQNKDFESLLKRLNEAAAPGDAPADAEAKEEPRDGDEAGEGDDSERKEKKRKRKQDRAEEKTKKKRRKSADAGTPADEAGKGVEGDTKVKVEAAPAEPPKAFVPRNRAHRARAIASKSIASKSSAAIAEILGIAPTPSNTTSASISGSATPSGKLESLDDGTHTLEKLTTSTKSVADYFKEKMLAKAKSGSGSATPRVPDDKQAEEEAPRGGLGLGASRLRVEVAEDGLDADRPRMGLGSKFSSSSLMAATFASPVCDVTPEEPSEAVTPVCDEPKKKEKRKKKKDDVEEDGQEEKKKRKEETEDELEEQDEQEKKKKKKEKKEKKKAKEEKSRSKEDVPIEDEAALAKEERRRLRKEKKRSEET
ncbi:hypothetical protein H0H81_007348 [Sphagnurus paluster]|uniref:PinX1-related protein 1 n=1 Tax=Sphagnurus paluster TaxID=117069 RepID=A0A9P7FQU0_9AGAR|nr:hypothetical protein H0H81_007348 [Sphagnurus paluster]